VEFNLNIPSRIEELTLRWIGTGTQIETSLDQQPLSNLKRLMVSKLGKNFPFHIMTNLEYLEMKQLKDSSFSGYIGNHGPFNCLSNLKVLKLGTISVTDEMNIDRLESGQWFSGLTSLTHLAIENGVMLDMGAIKQNMFKHCRNLETLDVEMIFFDVIEPGTYVYLLNLKHLDLYANGLTSFPFACLTNELANLEHLSLNSNHISSLDGLGYNGSLSSSSPSRVRVLDLGSNRMSIVLPFRAFSNVPSLVKLIMDYNNIEVIEAGAFEGLGNLRYLDLSSNKLRTFDFGAHFF
jgi:Leucine-rich repeat (LRR) protein